MMIATGDSKRPPAAKCFVTVSGSEAVRQAARASARIASLSLSAGTRDTGTPSDDPPAGLGPEHPAAGFRVQGGRGHESPGSE